MLRPLHALALALALGGCDAFFLGSNFEAEASGGADGSFSGRGAVHASADRVVPSVVLSMDDASGGLRIEIIRELFLLPAPGEYPLLNHDGTRDDRFRVAAGFFSGDDGDRLIVESGTLTIDSCSSDDLSGRYTLTGTYRDQATTLAGTFDLPVESPGGLFDPTDQPDAPCG